MQGGVLIVGGERLLLLLFVWFGVCVVQQNIIRGVLGRLFVGMNFCRRVNRLKISLRVPT